MEVHRMGWSPLGACKPWQNVGSLVMHWVMGAILWLQNYGLWGRIGIAIALALALALALMFHVIATQQQY